MTEKERETIEKFANQMEDISVPDSLHPDQMEKLLNEKCRKKKQPWWKKRGFYGGVAAALVLVVGVSAYGLSQRNDQPYVYHEDIETAENYKDIYNLIYKYQKEAENASA